MLYAYMTMASPPGPSNYSPPAGGQTLPGAVTTPSPAWNKAYPETRRVNGKQATQDSTSPWCVPSSDYPDAESFASGRLCIARTLMSALYVIRCFNIEPGHVCVNAATGAATLTVPTVAPHGREGGDECTANTQLVYNSLAGNGPFGIGWALGLPSGISRKTSQHVPTYTDGDVFMLAGAEDLVPVAGGLTTRDTYTIQTYLPRVQRNASSARIERWTSSVDDADQFWRTISNTGLTTIYGRTSSSRVSDPCSEPGVVRIFSWLPCVVYDTRGNTLLYIYKSEDSANVDTSLTSEHHRTAVARTAERYLKRIMQCNRTPFINRDSWLSENWEAQQSDYFFETVFDYGEHGKKNPSTAEITPWLTREDIVSSYNSGFEVRKYRLCRRVLLFHHFPDSVTKASSLMSSAVFQYCQSPVGSTLIEVTHKGHRYVPGSDEIHIESQAPLKLEYSQSRLVPGQPLWGGDLAPTTVDTSNLVAVPEGDDTQAQWLDLNLEGSPGILARRAGGDWVYLRNESQGGEEQPCRVSFGSAKSLREIPNLLEDGGNGFFTHLAADGTLQFFHSNPKTGQRGFYPRDRITDNWGKYVPFTQIPSTEPVGKDLQRLDLVGNGTQDAVEFLVDDQNRLRWYPSLGYTGFGPSRLAEGPDLPRQEAATSALFLVDMTGDGLTDVVYVSNSDILYWPNLGYGKFGARVRMGASPKLGTVDTFTTQRVLLVDIDGSGTSDLVYLVPGGGANIYLNMSGNTWSEPIFIASVPERSDLSSINVVDLLGQGTSCLCWTLPRTQGHGAPILRYIELMGQVQPHKLLRHSTGNVLETAVAYSPSTTFYLSDARAGRPWTTKLPFPVQCVLSVSVTDNVAKTKSVSTYSYHDGYYDTIEREFRGFASVDCWETETLAAFPGLSKFQANPRHSRTWYYTGSPTSEIVPDQWTGAEKINVEPNQMPLVPDGSREAREARRALKGLLLRSEVLGNSTLELYSTTQSSYAVVMEQSTGLDTRVGGKDSLFEPPHACFRVLDRETLHKSYERNSAEDDARIQHTLNLATNKYGQSIRSAIIYYGRRHTASRDQDEERISDVQSQTMIRYEEHDLTNVIDTPNAYLSPQSAESRSYTVYNVAPSPEAVVFSFDQVSADTGAFFHELQEIPFEDDSCSTNSGTKCKLLTSRERVYYRSSDLKTRLDLGKLEPLSILDRSYTLALTKGLLSQVYVDDGNKSLLHGFEPADGAYADLDKDGNWWISSSTQRYSKPGASSGTGVELDSARLNFYVPEYTINPRGAVNYQKLDQFKLFRVEMVDSVKNQTTYEYNYPFAEPIKTVDANDNIIEFAYDSFNMEIGTAVEGKEAESLGDSLDGFNPVLTDDELVSFMKSPLDTAPKLLGSAGSRCIYRRTGTSDDPAFQAEISRLHTHSRSPPLPGEFSIMFTYFDGRGNAIQRTALDTISPEPRWRLEGWQISSSHHAQSVQSFQPYWAADHKFRPRTGPHEELPPAAFSIYDPLDRLVATLHPDHTWETNVIQAWSSVHKDAGDNLLVDDMAQDPNVGIYISASLDPQTYSPSWYASHASSTSPGADKVAAEKSKVYNDTPDIVHFDAMGRDILSITSDRSPVRQTARKQFDAAGNTTAVLDSLDRLVCKTQYDMCQRLIAQRQMDGRVSFALQDAVNLDWLQWSRGDEPNRRRVEYDAAGRPLCHFLLLEEENITEEKIITRIAYGEDQTDDKVKNLRGRLWRTLDQSGSSTRAAYDFKGNQVQYDVQLASSFKSLLDWSLPEDSGQTLEKEVYTEHAIYNVSNKPYVTIAVNGRKTRRQYDVSGRLESLQVSPAGDETTWVEYVSSITYTPSGQRSTITYGNGASTAFTYDPLTLLETGCKSTVLGRTGATILRDIQTTYDCLARKVSQVDNSQQDVYFRNKVIRPQNDYTYDARGQLIIATGREKFDAESNTLHPYGPQYDLQSDLPCDDHLCRYTDLISYDSVGNITRLEHRSDDTKVSGWSRGYEYGDGNRLVRTTIGRVEDNYGYDSRGRMTSMPGCPTMEWDCVDRLRCTAPRKLSGADNGVAVETTWYVYNASGARVRKVTERADSSGGEKLRETLYLRCFTGFQVYREFCGKGEVRSEKKTFEVTAALPSSDSSPIALIEDSSTNISSETSSKTVRLVRYSISRGLEVDDNAKVISLEEYSPFGATTFRATDKRIVKSPSSYRYAGYIRDTQETGFYFCEARYYAPWLGRWTSPDPLGIADGLNTYRYATNDPINFIDSSGTMMRLDGNGDDGFVENTSRAEKKKSKREKESNELASAPDVEAGSADLGIEHHEIDDGAGGRVRVWSSMRQFSRPLTHEELATAARVAYDSMISDFNRRKDKNTNDPKGNPNALFEEPGVMTAFQAREDVARGTVIFSSSTRRAVHGGNPRKYYFTKNPTAKTLYDATADASKGGNVKPGDHRTGACGEIGAVHIAFGHGIALEGGTAVTYGTHGTQGSEGGPLIVPPCGGGDDTVKPQWGCTQMLRKAEIQGARFSKESETLPASIRKGQPKY